MTDPGDLRIPVAMRPTAEQVIKLTDKVCADLLDEEYVAYDDLAAAFGLSKSTLGQKAKQIRDTLKMT